MKVRSLIKSTYYIVLNLSNTLLHIFADSSILKNWNKVPNWKWWLTKITSIKKLREPKQCSKRNGWMLFMTSIKIVKKRDSYHQKTEWHRFWGKELCKTLGMAIQNTNFESICKFCGKIQNSTQWNTTICCKIVKICGCKSKE